MQNLALTDPLGSIEAYEKAYSTLSLNQQRFLAARILHVTDVDAAKECNISPETVYSWRQDFPAFNLCSSQMYPTARKAIIELLNKNGVLASLRLGEILSDKAANPDHTIRSAQLTYRALGLTRPGAVVQVNVYDVPVGVLNSERIKRGLEPIIEGEFVEKSE